jgi:hypothetical protein
VIVNIRNLWIGAALGAALAVFVQIVVAAFRLGPDPCGTAAAVALEHGQSAGQAAEACRRMARVTRE